jgi:hypothetical protein
MGWLDRLRDKLAVVRNANLLMTVAAGLGLRSRSVWGDEVSRHRLSIGPVIRGIATPPSGLRSTRLVCYGDDVMAMIAGDESGDSLSLSRLPHAIANRAPPTCGARGSRV